MTNEELKSFYLDLIKGLENGFVPNPDYSENYSKARENNTLESSLNELDDLNKKMNQGIDVSGFTKEAFKKLSDIRQIIDNDSLFLRNSGNEEFTKYLNEVKEQFNIAGDYLTNEQVLNNCEEVLADNEKLLQEAGKRKLEIINDKNLSMLDKSIMFAEANALYEKRLQARDLAIKTRDEQRKVFEKSLNKMKKDLDINEFINGILKSVNKLDVSYRNLAISSTSLEKLGDAIRDLRDKVVVFRNDSLFDETKYNEILKNCGLMKTTESSEEILNKINELKLTISKLDGKEENLDEVVEPVEKEKVTEEVNSFNVDDLIPEEIPLDEIKEEERPMVQEEPSVSEPKKITSINALVDEIKLINPSIDVENIDGTYTLVTDDIRKVVLPEGFNYDENLGINNKVNDFTPFISLDVASKTLEESTSKVEEPIVEENKEEVIEPVMEQVDAEEVKNVDTASIIPSGKIKVKKIRKAVVSPYVKSILAFGAIEGVCWVLAGSNPLTLASVVVDSALLGGLSQLIYKKLVQAGKKKGYYGNEEKEDLDPENKFWAYPVFDKFMGMFKNIRHGKKKEEQKPMVPEEPSVDEVKEETLDKPTEEELGFEQLFQNTLDSQLSEVEENSMGGR